jgi:dTDP-4-dehydrorhamnose reductase
VAARAHGAHLIHVSSDRVFDGESAPYDEDAPPSPITPYGRSKAEAEQRVRAQHPGARVVRSPLLYRMSPPDPSTGTWLEGVRQGQGYALFTDEIRCPAPVEDVAAAIVAIARALVGGEDEPLPGVMHLPGPEAISRHAFGRLVLAAHGLSPELARASVSGAGGTRPRNLTMLARRTPRAFTAGIRGPREALPAAAPTSPSAQRADRAERRS